jgi:NitT/TauT family transport system substrate-binding protein
MAGTWVRWVAIAVLGVGLVACGEPQPGLGAGAAAPSAAGAAAAAVAGQAPVRLAASQNVTSNIIVWLAHEVGLFAKNGVNVDLQSINATTAIKALVAGQLDGVLLGSPHILTARAAGSPLTIVGVFVQVVNQRFVVPAEITTVEQVRGKTVGVITKASINGEGTIRALRLFGLEPGRDYTLVETGSAGTFEALTGQLLARNVHAAALEPNFAQKAVTEGYRELFDLTTLDLPVAAACLAFKTDYVRQYPDQVQKVVDSLIESVRYAREHRAETQAAFSKYFRLTDPAELDATYENVVGQVLAKVPYPSLEQFPGTLEAMASEVPEVRSIDVATLIDRRFVDDAVRRGLTNY